MLTQIALLGVLAVLGPQPAAAHASDRPKVEVWTNRGDNPFATGQIVQVSFKTDQDAYVTVLRVDTDGRIRVLFPREPWGDNFARGGVVYEVPGAAASAAFRADAYPGEGYVFAMVAADPFTYDGIESDHRWNYDLIADRGRIRGDPYAALTELGGRMVPEGNEDWDYDIAPYYVQQHYDYPRFLCYDCHTYASFRSWNPYAYSCVRFRIVMFDDPYYYPYRQYGGTRAVFRRPLRPEPRFIFKDRSGSDPFITRVRERPLNDNRRRDDAVRRRDAGRPGQFDRSPRSDRPGAPDRPSRPAHRGSQGEADRAPARRSAPARRAGPGRGPPATESARPRPAPRAEPSRGSRPEQGRRSEPELRRRRP